MGPRHLPFSESLCKFEDIILISKLNLGLFMKLGGLSKYR
jgi:hypothetical protein